MDFLYLKGKQSNKDNNHIQTIHAICKILQIQIRQKNQTNGHIYKIIDIDRKLIVRIWKANKIYYRIQVITDKITIFHIAAYRTLRIRSDSRPDTLLN